MIRPAFLCLSSVVMLSFTAGLHASSPGQLPLPNGCELAQRSTATADRVSNAAPSFPPPQLEIRSPFPPSAFRAGGYRYLVYELQLLNASEQAMQIKRLDIIAADDGALVSSMAGPALEGKLSLIGGGPINATHPLAPGRSVTAFLCVAFAGDASVPQQLQHRVLLDDAVAAGPMMGTRQTVVKSLASPVRGEHWLADNGLALDLHHRPGLFVAGGLAQISRRYAIDWKQRINGHLQSGDPLDVRTYHAYAQPVFAVADAVVVQARDGMPDNTPRTAAGFAPALPLSMETLAGNYVVLDLGEGQYAHYAHLQPGSVNVKTGERVRRGQALARIGNSGDARWPHLHFQVTTGPDLMGSQGVPFEIEEFRARNTDGTWTLRRQEFPLLGDEVQF
ncbi:MULTISPECIES: M23 family metallopeptidase [Stenotrophomonas]|uniref:M23ase beta-sheet core domain-containing protein n=1 Tax=Stenotrophomonas maltophilia TaxID=40324 RepID=A0A2J0U989_STEMA|nr:MULTISPECIES: M23 family metallopeptidase [Stenotrophomonas]PJL25893.1 hypothetical protein B9Y64_15315 [Stenotrophomonas maltophilia]HDS1148062.1 M23 family metallopeptidase [Stenotrophomonas maltophilia]HDS1161340.1 M23 family metallopeptidase [Stenotrophomonas maltophilia]